MDIGRLHIRHAEPEDLIQARRNRRIHALICTDPSCENDIHFAYEIDYNQGLGIITYREFFKDSVPVTFECWYPTIDENGCTFDIVAHPTMHTAMTLNVEPYEIYLIDDESGQTAEDLLHYFLTEYCDPDAYPEAYASSDPE